MPWQGGKRVKTDIYTVSSLKTADLEQRRGCRGFSPENKLYKYWSWFMILPLLFTGTVMPYRLAFHDFRIDDGTGGREPDFILDVVIRVVVDICFVSDMVLCFFAGYYDEDGNTVSDLAKIRSRYLSTLFVFDFFACLPPELVNTVFGDDASSANKLTRLPRVTRLTSLSRLLKLTRMGRLSKFMRIFKVFRYHPFVVAVTRTLWVQVRAGAHVDCRLHPHGAHPRVPLVPCYGPEYRGRLGCRASHRGWISEQLD
jgi:hypothetical protein